ncbi:MAG: membrane dipeptidase [Planctomycetales bacterium]|nr:membrane dipeptidase [Planctomycetales bacterium]
MIHSLSARCCRPGAFLLLLLFVGSASVPAAEPLDCVIRGGSVYDGTGAPPVQADVGVRGDRIVAVGDLSGMEAKRVIDARGMAVAPGFINMLSWATESLLHDPRSQSDIRQGVTLEVMGEGWSMGPLNPTMKRNLAKDQSDIKYEVPWTTLGEYLRHLEQRGVSCNVASFVGATTVRIHVLGYDDREPTPEELQQMKDLVREAMQDGALGVGSSLIYAPAFYAKTDELVELCKVAAEYDGIYISHMRSEGNRLFEAVDELLDIAKRANIGAEIYHLKAAGQQNFRKLDQVIRKIEWARSEGMQITADVYTYTAGATGLNAAMPPWVQEGGYTKWRDRLRDPEIRQRVLKEMTTPTDEWENLMMMAGSPDKVLLVGFDNPDLKHLTGKTLAEVARQRKQSPEETAINLVIEDGSRVECVYFFMSEKNVRKKIALPWVSFDSDAGSLSPEGEFLKSNPHPRAYGCFARLLGKYVRDEQLLPLELAIHKLTQFPARTLGIRGRGELKAGRFADIVVFDPKTIIDKATYEQPHQFAVGVRDVLVNGQLVLLNGDHTGATPGRVVYGPGKFRGAKRPPVELTDRARQLHASSYVWDGHNDLPWEIRNKASSSFAKLDIAQAQSGLHTDIPRLRAGNVGAQFWSAYVPAETRKSGEALRQTLEQIELVHAMVKRYPDVFEMADTADDVVRIQKAGKIASMIGVEGGHSIEDSIENLRRLYKLGVRYMTLTHSDSLAWADSATDDAASDGLSAFGEEVVREMNRLGMAVDLSHVADSTMLDALRVSKAPVIYSHSSARAIADHPRNVPDTILRRVAANNGIVMVNFFSGFVVPESAERMKTMFDVSRELREKFPKEEDYQRERRRWRARNPIDPGNIHHVVDHIEHIIRVAGIDHVGLGSDFDGVTSLPSQLEDVSTYPLITQELLNRGYQDDEIRKVLSENMLRVLRDVERVAQELQQDR